MEFLIFSKALYSTWIFYKPERLLFDAGEGVSTYLGNRIFAISSIFLTHGHVDHISGLWGIVNSRNNAMGDREKPLQVYYPRGNRAIEAYLDFISRANSDLRYHFREHPVEAGSKIFLRKAGSFERYIVPFKVKHTRDEISFGYHLIEKRSRLKPEYAGLDPREIAGLVKKLGRDRITENYESKILTISGDSMALPVEEAKGTHTLIHECTFMDIKERKFPNHVSIEELIPLIHEARPKRVILYHISTRFERRLKHYKEMIEKEFKGEDMEFHFVHPSKIFKL
ncbi:MAG: ribonuclease [Thermotogota bacterium]|nr:ribonuclease [Thermotogota bacterium]MDK2865145.1 ribonuclease [Thermotogota bacterium]HCZ06790.1 MBL fold metallo-hydrolase [Thermotogota bacterium]